MRSSLDLLNQSSSACTVQMGSDTQTRSCSKNYPSLKLLGVGLTDYNLMRLQVNAFKNDADTAISESDSAFQARVNRAPRPSGS